MEKTKIIVRRHIGYPTREISYSVHVERPREVSGLGTYYEIPCLSEADAHTFAYRLTYSMNVHAKENAERKLSTEE